MDSHCCSEDGYVEDEDNNSSDSKPTVPAVVPALGAQPTDEESAPVWVQVVSPRGYTQVLDAATGVPLEPRRLEQWELKPHDSGGGAGSVPVEVPVDATDVAIAVDADTILDPNADFLPMTVDNGNAATDSVMAFVSFSDLVHKVAKCINCDGTFANIEVLVEHHTGCLIGSDVACYVGTTTPITMTRPGPVEFSCVVCNLKTKQLEEARSNIIELEARLAAREITAGIMQRTLEERLARIQSSHPSDDPLDEDKADLSPR